MRLAVGIIETHRVSVDTVFSIKKETKRKGIEENYLRII